MAGLEGVIRPFVGLDVGPTPFHPDGAVNVPPVRLAIGLVGGTKTFSFSQSATLTSYMAAVHTEKSVTSFDMSTGKLTGA
jgi:hypothetical protein